MPTKSKIPELPPFLCFGHQVDSPSRHAPFFIGAENNNKHHEAQISNIDNTGNWHPICITMHEENQLARHI